MALNSNPVIPARYLFKSAVVVAILTVLMSIVWDAVFPGRIYYCTDETGPDYLQPGNWVHGQVEVVDDVRSAASGSMGDPDVILQGWTTGGLWMIWAAMFGSSIVLGLALAGFPWIPESKAARNQKANEPCEEADDNAPR